MSTSSHLNPALPTRCTGQPMNFDILYGPGVFSLVCCSCDDSSHIHSLDDAIAEGWTDITEDLDMAQANYVGRCPDCRELVEE